MHDRALELLRLLNRDAMACVLDGLRRLTEFCRNESQRDSLNALTRKTFYAEGVVTRFCTLKHAYDVTTEILGVGHTASADSMEFIARQLASLGGNAMKIRDEAGIPRERERIVAAFGRIAELADATRTIIDSASGNP